MINLYIFDDKSTRSSVYGIGAYINQLAILLRQSDINVCFIHLNSDTQRFFRKVENGVAHWYLPCPKVKYTDDEKYQQLYLQKVVLFLKKHIHPTDQLIFHLNYPKFPSFAEALKASFNCKIVVAVHYLSWCFDLLGNVSRLQNIINKPENNLDALGKQVKKSFNEEKNLFCSVDNVISLSKHTTEILQKIYKVEKQKITIIYNGLEDTVQKELDRELICRKYNIPIEAPVIIFAGRLDPAKGLTYFIQASKIVLDQFPNNHVIIAGSGDYDTYMKECGNRWMNIHFTGLLEKSDLYELFSIADIGVMPSFHEQCSYVAIEMMMHGVPLIASTSTGLYEMVEDGITGLHIPVIEHIDRAEINTDLLAEKILFLLQNHTEGKRIGANARRRYEKQYSIEVFRRNMIRFYESLFED